MPLLLRESSVSLYHHSLVWLNVSLRWMQVKIPHESLYHCYETNLSMSLFAECQVKIPHERSQPACITVIRLISSFDSMSLSLLVSHQVWYLLMTILMGTKNRGLGGYQDVLPSLPVPPLNKTCKKWVYGAVGGVSTSQRIHWYYIFSLPQVSE